MESSHKDKAVSRPSVFLLTIPRLGNMVFLFRRSLGLKHVWEDMLFAPGAFWLAFEFDSYFGLDNTFNNSIYFTFRHTIKWIVILFKFAIWLVDLYILTHWGRRTHICVRQLTIISSDNGLLPGRRRAIIWTRAGMLLIKHLGRNFSDILIRIELFSFKKMHLKISSAKWRPFCLGLNVLMAWTFTDISKGNCLKKKTVWIIP